MTATPITVETVPGIWFKAKRVIRTIIAVIVGIVLTFLSTVAALQLFAPAVLAELAKVLDPATIAWLSSALAVLVLWAGVITRIMAIPQVNAFLTKFGAGSVPASAVTGTGSEIDVTAIKDPERAAAELSSEVNRRA